MNCPRCQHENIENHTFCIECGAQLIPDPPIGPVDLEHIRFEFERAKWRTDTELRRREVELKEAEDRRRRGFFARIDPISVGIFRRCAGFDGERHNSLDAGRSDTQPGARAIRSRSY